MGARRHHVRAATETRVELSPGAAPRWLVVAVCVSLGLNAVALIGLGAVLANPSVSGWAAARLHVASVRQVDDAQDTADESSADLGDVSQINSSYVDSTDWWSPQSPTVVAAVNSLGSTDDDLDSRMSDLEQQAQTDKQWESNACDWALQHETFSTSDPFGDFFASVC